MNNEQTIREIHMCLFYKEAGESRAEISRITGLNTSLVKTRLAQVKAALVTHLLPHPELQSDYPLESAQLREEQLTAQVSHDITLEANRNARTVLRNEFVQEELLSAIGKMLPAMQGKTLRATKRKQGGNAVGIVISDVHVGKETDHFKPQDALDCISSMVQTGIDEAVNRNADELIICLLGDILDGYGIYKTQTSEVSLTATEQFIQTLQVLGDSLFAARSGFDGKITVVGIAGNHGRVNTPELASWENFETLMYNTLAIWFRDSDINFVMPSRENFYVIYRDVFFFHGHEISGSGTLDGIIQRCRHWLTMLAGPTWKLSICGHFHRLMVAHYPPDCIHLVNGTATRGDMFIQRLGAFHTNKWWMFCLDADNNPTELIPVTLYEEQS